MDQMERWCRLDHELLSLILSHLLGGDIIAFLAVCKWWKETPLPITQSSILAPSVPLLLLPSNKLFDPIFKYSHPIQVNEEFPRGAIFRASRCGWLLMTSFRCCVFFFNPFTKENIQLVDMPFTHQWPYLTFSSPPTSPDCVVFAVQQKPTSNNNMIIIYTLKHGDPDWTVKTFHARSYFKLSSCNPIMFKGLYYCLGNGGSLLIYNFATKKCEWRGPPKPPLHRNQSIISRRYYMVESQGKLLLVSMDLEGSLVKVAKYTAMKNIWDKVDNLGDTMLFVSQVTSFSSKSVVSGTGNKIYLPNFVGETDNQLFYSLATRKYHCLLGGRSWTNILETRSYANCTWIKPCDSS